MMLTILVALSLTAALIIVLGRSAGSHAAELGSMSSNWIAANRAGERNSSS